MTREHRSGPFVPYRGLDLTEDASAYCGKLLADLGARIIKVERPGGDPARHVGPFMNDIPDPERSISWHAFNSSKRSITLDLETIEGREELKTLVETADFFIESYPPGYLDGLGLGYDTLSEINPGLILTSITPFGQTGPYRAMKASELTLWAMSGTMINCGYLDRAPLGPGTPQSYLHGALHGAVGTALALHGRNLTAKGQHVDVSILEALLRVPVTAPQSWLHKRMLIPRAGNRQGYPPHLAPLLVWPCRGGEIMFNMWGGVFGRLVQRLVDWMNESGRAGHLKDVDWNKLDVMTLSSEDLAANEEVFLAFFAEHTKEELADEAFKRLFPLAPVRNMAEVFADKQLRARNFLVEVENPALGGKIVYPGAPFNLSATPCTAPTAAPRIGEHNAEIRAELASATRSAGVVAAPPDGEGAAEHGKGPLVGFKILDFSRAIAGPWSASYLADFGAEVIKIESLANLDNARTTGPYKDIPGDIDGSYFGVMVNSGKRAMALNLKTEKGLEIVKKLIRWADVVVENYGPGVMDRWGLGYAGVRKLNPSIVMLSSSSQGQTGPLANLIGFGTELQGRSGFTYMTGWPDRISVPPTSAYPDVIAPWFGAVAILAALDHRGRTGQGQYIDLSQHETGVTFLSQPLLDYAINGRILEKHGNRSPDAAPHGAYPCRGDDRWCAITVLDESQWESFRHALGNPAWAQDRRFSTLAGRKAHEDELDALIAAWTRERSAEEVMALLQRAGVPAGVAQTAEDLVDKDPHVHDRGFFILFDKPGFGDCLHYAWPVKLSRTPSRPSYGPLYNEHTHYVCSEILKMPSDEFVQLLNEGVLR
ncbi:MAG: CoA transferase [Candidatus Binatia bacterium]